MVPWERAEDAIGAAKARVSDELDAARRYWQQAEQLRRIARDIHTKRYREALLNTAADYEGMAESMIAIDKTKRQLRTPRNSN